jgi:hypothetical protein
MTHPTPDRSVQQPYQERIEALGEQLRAKISSKFQASSVLAGLAATMLSVQVAGTDASAAANDRVSTSLTLSSLVLYIAALIYLDSLAMPKRFWRVDETTSSPDSRLGNLTDDDLCALKTSMVFDWVSHSLVATALMAFAVGFMLYETSTPSVHPVPLKWPLPVWGWSLIVTLAYLVVMFLIHMKSFRRPMRPCDQGSTADSCPSA